MKNGVPEFELTINQGDDFYCTVQLSKGDSPLDITGCTFKFGGRYNLTNKRLNFVGQVEVVDSHTIRLYIPNEVTGRLQANTDYKVPKKAYYDVQMIKNGHERRILQGVANIYAGNAFRVTGLDDVPEDIDHVRDLIAKEVSKIADIDMTDIKNLSGDVDEVKKSIDGLVKGQLTADQVSKLIAQNEHLTTEQVNGLITDAINKLDGEGEQF